MDVILTARQASDYNRLTAAQRDEFQRLIDAGRPVPAALYAARQLDA